MRAVHSRQRFFACVLVLTAWFVPAAASVAEAAVRQGGDSSYIRSHKDDLVRWLPWDENTLEQAKASGKLILLSSGYYACRYCYVLKKESFEDPVISGFINENFIPVLIDREMHPVLDGQLQQFMDKLDAPQGWPINVLLTPDTHPLVGTMYRPPGDFLQILQSIHGRWQNEAEELHGIARSITERIVADASRKALRIGDDYLPHFLGALRTQALLVADSEYGGFGNDAKYPMSPQLMALLELQQAKPDERLAAHLRLTLDAMAEGGLRDPLDGGFFRYTTDRRWRTPHYERMLYDNVQLAAVYLLASQVFEEPAYLGIAEQNLNFVSQRFMNEHHGLVSSLSAVDAEGRDGGYYLWSEQELKRYLNDSELNALIEASQVTMLNKQPHYLPIHDAGLDGIRSRLLELRSAREQPRDTKTVAGWNGLGLKVFSRAAQITGEQRYRVTAKRIHRYISGELIKEQHLMRTAEGGTAMLEDYAYVASGLQEYADLTGKAAHYEQAREIIEQAWKRFYIEGFWRRSEKLELLLPFTIYPLSLPDTELPSPSATLAGVTLAMGDRVGAEYRESADNALRHADSDTVESPFFYSTQITRLVRKLETD